MTRTARSLWLALALALCLPGCPSSEFAADAADVPADTTPPTDVSLPDGAGSDDAAGGDADGGPTVRRDGEDPGPVDTWVADAPDVTESPDATAIPDVTLVGICCFEDADCATGLRCVGETPDGAPGHCKPPAEPGACWGDEDCEGAWGCEGEQLCPCDADCDMEDQPGACRTPEGCCEGDADCAGGESCTPDGLCVPTPAFGQCWTDDDCYETQTCAGATWCPCGTVCGQLQAPGACTPLPTGCCYGDDGCDDGFVCRAEGAGDGLPGRCVPDPLGPACVGDAACCWEDADCGPGGTCGAVNVCGCITLCPVCGACAPDRMGFCE